MACNSVNYTTLNHCLHVFVPVSSPLYLAKSGFEVVSFMNCRLCAIDLYFPVFMAVMQGA